MACLNSLDLIATPGRRHVELITALSGTSLRTQLAAALQASGWTVDRADFLGSVGYKATSAPSPWCATGPQPDDYSGKCRVWFRKEYISPAAFADLTSFLCMSADEDIHLTQTSTEITVTPATNNTFGNYTGFQHIFIGTPYDFKLFMLGVDTRVAGGISNDRTAVFAGVPQIPGFLQQPAVGWPNIGVTEMFYCVDASAMRTGGVYSGHRFFAGGVKSSHGRFMNTNNGGVSITDGLFSWFITFGVDGGNGSEQAIDSGVWISDPTGNTIPNYRGQIWPPTIAWGTDPANAVATRFLKGFMWDAVVLNKGFQADNLFRIDKKVFIVFNNNFTGIGSPYQPAAALLLRVM